MVVAGDTVIDDIVGLGGGGVGGGGVGPGTEGPPGLTHSTFCDQGAGATQFAVFAFAAVVRVIPCTV